MNVALAGTHGVGKTTLGKSLTDYFGRRYRVKFSTGIPRKLICQGFPLGRDATMESYVSYIAEQLNALRESAQYDLYISDRTLLDTLAYALVNRNNGASSISDRELDILQRVWELERRHYDFFLYIPIQFEMKSDGIRPEGETYREEISNQIEKLLQDSGLKWETVTGSKHAMLRSSIKLIGKVLDKNSM